MAKKANKFLIGNWKMNPQTVAEAEKLFKKIKPTAVRFKNTHVVLCPPTIFLGDIEPLYRGEKISFGAQDIFWEMDGAYTGEISASQLVDAGVSYVLIGHSERRALGEDNESVKRKLEATLRHSLTPVLCVGETKRDHGGEYLSFITEQITSAFEDISVKDVSDVVIAYEPVWAIGKDEDDAMTAHELHQMSLFVRKILTNLYDAKTARKVSVIYGGSVKRENAEELISEGNIDGFLVGSASLDAEHFLDIGRIIENS